jgi:endoglucanase
MARRIRETSIANTPSGPVILPAQQGFERGGRYTLNPSYWVYPAIDVLALVDEQAFWSQVRSAGLRLLALSRFPVVGGVPPDWIVLHPDARLGLPDDPSRRRFGFEALRIPLYLCWAGITDRDLFSAYLAVWSSDDTPAWVDLANGDRAAYALQRSHRAARSVLQRCLGQRVAPPAAQLLVDETDYYGSTLMLFATLPHPNAKQSP